MSEPKIEIRDLSIVYVNVERGTSHVAVEDLTFDINADEFLCVVGPSGCGKSTLIAAIAGFVKARSGTLLMDSRPITRPGGGVSRQFAPAKGRIVALGDYLKTHLNHLAGAPPSASGGFPPNPPRTPSGGVHPTPTGVLR